MENPPPKHDKNNNSRIRPPTINLGVVGGGLGIGGIVLLGGALVTATVVSAFAFKTRSQRRSSSDDDDDMKKKNMSKNILSDGVSSMKEEVRTKSSQTLTPDEKHGSVPSGDDTEDIIVSRAVKDQENTSVHADSEFKSEEIDDGYEKIDLDSEEQLAMADQIEASSCLGRYDDNKNDEHVDANSSVSEEDIVFMEEYEAVEAKANATENEDENQQETVFVNKAVEAKATENEDEDRQETIFMNKAVEAEATDNEDEDHQETVFINEAVEAEATENEDEDHQETVFINEAVETEATENEDKDYQETVFTNETVAMEAVCVNQIKVEDNLQVQILKQNEKDYDDEIVVENQLSDDTDYADQIVHEVVMEEPATDATSLLQIEEMGETEKEEVIIAACGNLVNMEDSLKIADNESGQQMQMNQVCEKIVVECVMNSLKEAVDDQTAAKEDAPLIRLMNKEEKEEEMVTEHELVNKDEIPHVQSIEENEDNEEDVTVKGELSSDEPDTQEELTPAAKMNNHKTEDKTTMGGKHALASELWNLKLMIWAAVLISVWCLCHWYSELPFAELSLAGSLFILMLLGYRNRTTYALTWSFFSNHKSGIIG